MTNIILYNFLTKIYQISTTSAVHTHTSHRTIWVTISEIFTEYSHILRGWTLLVLISDEFLLAPPQRQNITFTQKASNKQKICRLEIETVHSCHSEDEPFRWPNDASSVLKTSSFWWMPWMTKIQRIIKHFSFDMFFLFKSEIKTVSQQLFCLWNDQNRILLFLC